MTRTRRVALCGALVAAAVQARAARADPPEAAPMPVPAPAEPPPPTTSASPVTPRPPVRREGMLPEVPGLFLPVGVNAGSVSHPTGASGAVIGGEASVVIFPVGHGMWSGLYADVVYDSASQRTRMSPGLEAGYLFLGVDGGPVFQLGDPGVRTGLQIRPMLSLGVLHFYGRWGWLGGDPADNHFTEVGVLLKYPIHLADFPRDE